MFPNTNAQTSSPTPATCPGGAPYDGYCNCMKDLVDINNPSCTANDFDFGGVTGFVVYDALAQDPCNCNCWTTDECNALGANAVDCRNEASPINCGNFDIDTVFGACLGKDF